MEIIAGGASLAPRRWSLPAEATDMRKSSWYSSTASTTQVRKTKKRKLSIGSSPGSSRLTLPYESDQLLCLPEPLMPSKGFSWVKHTKPWWEASRRIFSMVSRFSSIARFEFVKSGANSCWAGATSLCLVFAETPKAHRSSSTSFMKLFTVGRIAPK